MSTAFARIGIEGVQEPKGPQLVSPSAEPESADSHPLLPIVGAMIIASVAAVTFVGSIVAWLALRSYGVLHP